MGYDIKYIVYEYIIFKLIYRLNDCIRVTRKYNTLLEQMIMNHIAQHYDIVIIDSGVNKNHPSIENTDVESISIHSDGNYLVVDNSFDDAYGHGTLMYNIVKRDAPEAKILNVKIAFRESNEDAVDNLVNALNYIYDNISCNVINISMGVRSSTHRAALETICRKITSHGTIIVSAFDNAGCISFPAAFDCVIGVDSSENVKSIRGYEFVENSIVNVCGKGSAQRIKWDNPSYIVAAGTSVACAHISAVVYHFLKDGSTSFSDLLAKMKNNAENVISLPIFDHDTLPDDHFEIKAAAIFPFNKEMHALVRFQNILPFHIESIHDVRYSGRVGASCNKLLGIVDGHDYIIQNVDTIPWDRIDTLILGHCEKLNHIMNSDVRFHLVSEAVKRCINIYSYDNISHYGFDNTNMTSKVYWPQLRIWNVPIENRNKLYHIDKPVLAIMGTSSAQGKYTLQNKLRQKIAEKGYQVGTISTEPNGYLLDMDYVFAIGYDADIQIDEHEKIQIVNKMVYETGRQNDIIIAAGQAGSIPFTSYIVDKMPVKQHAFIMGLDPDLIVLCVNPYDQKEYVLNTIKYLEGIGQCKVCGLALFPMNYKSEQLDNSRKYKMSKDEIHLFCNTMESEFSRPCYSIFDDEDVARMTEMIIDELSD